MSIQPIQSVNSHLTPLMEYMRQTTDSLPNNSLPKDTQGTIQEQVHLLPPVTLYNSHGVLKSSNPNSLIAHA